MSAHGDAYTALRGRQRARRDGRPSAPAPPWCESPDRPACARPPLPARASAALRALTPTALLAAARLGRRHGATRGATSVPKVDSSRETIYALWLGSGRCAPGRPSLSRPPHQRAAAGWGRARAAPVRGHMLATGTRSNVSHNAPLSSCPLLSVVPLACHALGYTALQACASRFQPAFRAPLYGAGTPVVQCAAGEPAAALAATCPE